METATNNHQPHESVGAWRVTLLQTTGHVDVVYFVGSRVVTPGMCTLIAQVSARYGTPAQVEECDLTAILDDLVEWADERALMGVEE
jgi:hypothetical protein